MFMCVLVYVYTCKCVRICVKCIDVYMYLCICMNSCIWVYMYVYMYAVGNVYMYM